MAPPSLSIDYHCTTCGWDGQVKEHNLTMIRHYSAAMRTVGDFTCMFDERLLCDQCRPVPSHGETDLRQVGDYPDVRIEVTHVHRQVRRVIWLALTHVRDLESTLLRRRNAEYLGPAGAPERVADGSGLRAHARSHGRRPRRPPRARRASTRRRRRGDRAAEWSLRTLRGRTTVEGNDEASGG